MKILRSVSCGGEYFARVRRLKTILMAPQRRMEGNLLMVALIVMGVIGVLVVGSLSLVRSQNVAVVRSQSWNACIPIIEAGVEEAMAHLNTPVYTNITSDAWTLTGGVYTQAPRSIGDGYYTVGIILTNVLRPVIVCTGYVALSAAAASAQDAAFSTPRTAVAPTTGRTQYLARIVRVTAEKTPIFIRGMVSREQIVMGGNGIYTDGFDSHDPLNPLGLYATAVPKAIGDISTLWRLPDAIYVGNAGINGQARTGPGGVVQVSAGGKVGDFAWASGLQPGWVAHDLNMSFPDVRPPFNDSPPGIAKVAGGITYVGDGRYKIGNLTLSGGEHLVVTGKVVLYVTGSIDISGSAAIDVIAPGTLNLYMAGASSSIGGTGINNTGRAESFLYWGLPTHTSLVMKASTDFSGAIYAPNAVFKMVGGGSSTQNFVGACVVRSVTVSGHYHFHYDQALKSFGPPVGYNVVSWIEL